MSDINIATKFYADTVLKGSGYTPTDEEAAADKATVVSKQYVLDNAGGGGSDEWPDEYKHKVVE